MKSAIQSVTVRRTFPAARERVFDAFQREESLAQWFSPSDQVEIQILGFNFRPEGRFRFRYLFPDGRQNTINGIYRTISPPSELAFSWIWEAPDPHAGVETEVIIKFVSRGGGTEVAVTHDRLPDRELEDRYVAGWTSYLERLALFVSTPGFTRQYQSNNEGRIS